MRNFVVDCPGCGCHINVPFVEELEKHAIDEYDLAEVSAQDKLFSLNIWLAEASLWTFLVYWWRHKLLGVKCEVVND